MPFIHVNSQLVFSLRISANLPNEKKKTKLNTSYYCKLTRIVLEFLEDMRYAVFSMRLIGSKYCSRCLFPVAGPIILANFFPENCMKMK